MKIEFLNKSGTFPRTVLVQVVKYMHKCKGKLCTIEFKFVRATRSVVQNAYYWSVVIKYISEETGFTPEEIHELLKYKFGKRKEIFGEEIIVSTTEYDTIEFEAYLSGVRNWSSNFLSCYIPLPNETDHNYLNLK